MRNSFCIMLLLTLFSACGNDVISEESPASYFDYSIYDDEDNCTIDGLSEEAKKIENLQLVIPGYIKGKQVTKVNISREPNILTVTLPDGIIDVSLPCCDNLVDINIPDSVKYLNLSGCKSLLIVELPDGIKTVILCSSYIWPDDDRLPDSIEQLDLSNNSAIRHISIPKSMETFEIDFNSFDRLETFYIPSTLETLEAPYSHSSSDVLMGTREIYLNFEQTDIPLKLDRNVFPEYYEYKDGRTYGCRFSMNISRPIEAECESCKTYKECELYMITTRSDDDFYPIYTEKTVPLCRRCAILNQK